MGGSSIGLIQTVLGAATGFMQPKPHKPSDNTAELEAQRAAEKEEQRQEEAAERKRERDKVLEARTAEKSVRSKAAETTLLSGGAGLGDSAPVATAKLKQKLGE
ncbi:hypothetical protein [Pseudodesulfovibrio sp.]|uniref:hypothetical protein n=1 Tax=unclassified Pseudodesulfovibrio TaxID=2661612 RepID=UPI003B004108